ncbi:hypothetical protein QCA50_005532 [Cerrena zonata]|uniref:BTB domain-containing protein n=1 Tax=Cerrena zonata TaxID=2478898 RepID=A0AAW0GFG0_9APHY
MSRAVDAGLWFNDGNIVLVAEDTPFKVYGGLLSQKSEVFRDILAIPQPATPDEAELMDGIHIIHVSDTWRDLSHVLHAIYHGFRVFAVDQHLSFLAVSALLRLGQKYEIPELKEAATSLLKSCFPERLADFKYDTKLQDDPPYYRYIIFDPPLIRMRLEDLPGVINLARAYGLPSLLPSAFYLCSLLEVKHLMNGTRDHDGNKIFLPKKDIIRCVNGRATLVMKEIIELPRISLRVADGCESEACNVADMFQPTDNDWSTLVKYAGTCFQDLSWLKAHFESEDCLQCRTNMEEELNAFRVRLWSTLGGIFLLDDDDDGDEEDLSLMDD